MKRYIHCTLLAATALLCLAFVLIPSVGLGTFLALMSFPFVQIGNFLRFLSLSGFAGNIGAIAIYIAICLAPLLLLLRKSKKYYWEDSLLILLCAVLFAVIYLMINPSSISLVKDYTQALPLAKAILGGSVYSVLTGYMVLRALRLFNKSETKRLTGFVTLLLYILNIMFIAVICIGCFGNCVSTIKEMLENNSANQNLYAINFIFTVLKFITESLPYAFNIAIVFAAIKLCSGFDAENAKRLSKICSISLIAVVLSNILINLAQLIFSGSLFNVNTVVQIPLFSIIFVLACLLFAQIIKENAALKAENDGFI